MRCLYPNPNPQRPSRPHVGSPPPRQVFGFADRPCLKRFEEVCDDLLSEYLHRIKAQVLKWFGNIRRQPLEVVPAADKTLITSQPEDMFNIIHVQVEVAKEKLPLERLKEVVNACLQVATTPTSKERAMETRSEAERPCPSSPFFPAPCFRVVSHTGPPRRATSKLRPAVVHVAADGRGDAVLGRQ